METELEVVVVVVVVVQHFPVVTLKTILSLQAFLYFSLAVASRQLVVVVVVSEEFLISTL